jgi:hypothetical protein
MIGTSRKRLAAHERRVKVGWIKTKSATIAGRDEQINVEAGIVAQVPKRGWQL